MTAFERKCDWIPIGRNKPRTQGVTVDIHKTGWFSGFFRKLVESFYAFLAQK
jgi:hypothetical protein